MSLADTITSKMHSISFGAVMGIFNSFALKGMAVLMSFGLITLAARVLGAHDFGTYSILFSTAGLSAVIGTAGQQVLLMRSWSEYGAEADTARLKGALIYGATIAGIGCLASALVAGFSLSFFYATPLAIATGVYLFALGFALISSHLIRSAVGVGLGDGLFAFMQPAPAFIYLMVCGLGQFTPDLTWVIILLTIGCSITVLIHAIALWREIQSQFPTFNTVKPIFEQKIWGTRSLKLWLSNGLESANQYLDVLIVGLLMTPTIAGAYFVTTRLANAFAIAADAMYWYSSRRIPDLYFRKEKQQLADLLDFVAKVNLGILIAGMTVVILLGHWMLYVFNPDYQAYYYALVLLCFGTAAVTAVGPSNSILMFTGHEGTTLKINAATVLMRTIGFFALVPLFNVTGAVVASTISFWFIALILRNSTIRLAGVDGSITRLWPSARKAP